jgi:hypothetical protein
LISAAIGFILLIEVICLFGSWNYESKSISKAPVRVVPGREKTKCGEGYL